MFSVLRLSLDGIISVFCFFKQKTAYEMRISDWSSDVCSSDLPGVWIAARACQFRGMPNIGLRHSQTCKRLLWARFPAKIVKTPSCVACRQAAQLHRHARHRARRCARVELGAIRKDARLNIGMRNTEVHHNRGENQKRERAGR